jgi:hypothetical protein
MLSLIELEKEMKRKPTERDNRAGAGVYAEKKEEGRFHFFSYNNNDLSL